MNKTKFLFIFIIANFIITTGQATTWSVSGTDGSNDEVQINQAIQAAISGDTVYLPAGTYTIAMPIQLKSGINLQGAGTSQTTIYVPNKADFNSDNEPAMLVGSSDRDIDISGINFKGPGLSPADVHDESQTYYGGHGQHHAAMRFTSCTNIRVHDCSCELLLNDFVRTSRSSYIYVYNNVMNMHGHDGCQLYRTSNIQVYNNYIVVFINCGVRVAECTNATIYSNTFTSYSASGWNGVQIQGGSTGILVSKNVFTDMKDNYCCIGLQTSGSGCVIRDNIGYNVPGFLSNLGSATTSNNNIHKSKQDWAALGYGYSGKTTSIIVPTETVTVPKKQTTLVTPVTANKTTPVNNTVGIVMNTTIKPISNITEICEETQQIEKPDQCNESIAENVTLGTENITESYSENKTSDYLKPVIIAYEDCVVRVYKIPENVSPISYENGITVTASTT